MILRICLCLAFALTTAAPARADEVFPALYRVTGVATNDVLNIRAAANANAPILGTLKPDAKRVEVMAMVNGWALVNADIDAGYVNARYLTRQGNDDWFDLTTPLTCLGTEPFWSLAINPGQRAVTISNPSGERSAVITQVWPGDPWHPGAALATNTGFATLTPGQCSDGMSNRAFGITADLFLGGETAARYSGCCTLVP